MGADLHAVVRRQIPILLEKIIAIPAFITDSPSIQLIRVLCHQFDEAVHHLYHSAVNNDTQSSSQASSNLSCTPLEDVYPLNNNNLDINITFTSTNDDDSQDDINSLVDANLNVGTCQEAVNNDTQSSSQASSNLSCTPLEDVYALN
ncbi:unnamed protein product, partial [Rotaria sordida]